MKVIFRGQKARFLQTFLDGITPLVPLNANWPKYAIYDPNNSIVQNGLGTLQAAGTYFADWTPLLTAELSNELGNWRVEWQFKDITDRQYTFTENFELKDDVKIEEAGREQKYIALGGQPYLAKIKVPIPLSDVSVKVLQKNNESVVATANMSQLKMRSYDGIHSYEFTVASLKADCEYVILWSIKDTPVSIPRFQFQVVTALSIKKMALIPEVRMLIDKFQKISGTYQGYEDSDIIEYLEKGLQMVNSVYPSTFGWGSTANSPWFVGGLQYFWIMAAGWYGLQAQYLIEADLAFNFTGLTTTLEMDRTAMIEAAMTRMGDHIKDALPAAKMTMSRKIYGMGHVGTRIFGRRATFENISYKIGNMTGSDIISYLTGVGIFFP
jgi:hypothetical protein